MIKKPEIHVTISSDPGLIQPFAGIYCSLTESVPSAKKVPVRQFDGGVC